MNKRHILALAVVIPFLGACTQQETVTTAAPPPVPASPLHPVASIRDIMAGMIAPAADEVWGAVAVRSTVNGLEESAPETDEDWEQVRFQALQMIEASNLLMMEDRQVVLPGQQLLDAGLEGNLTAEQIQAAFEEQRSGFISFAQAFQNAAMESLTAIDAQDTEALSNAGGTLDEACENCHTTFWYPMAQ